jgi:hypothetical protein
MMQLPKTKAEAKALRLPRFFTGRPCKRNHIAERRAACGTCVECATIAEEKYRNNNRETYNANGAKWRKANRKLASERAMACHRANPEPSRRAAKKFYDANSVKCRKSSNDWRTENREWVRETTAEWKKNNRARCTALQMLRHATKMRATPRSLTDEHKAEMVEI